MSAAGGAGGRRPPDDGGGFGAGRRAPPAAAGLSRTSCVTVRLLHSGVLNERLHLPAGNTAPDRRSGAGGDLRQYLSVHRLYPHYAGHSAGESLDGRRVVAPCRLTGEGTTAASPSPGVGEAREGRRARFRPPLPPGEGRGEGSQASKRCLEPPSPSPSPRGRGDHGCLPSLNLAPMPIKGEGLMTPPGSSLWEKIQAGEQRTDQRGEHHGPDLHRRAD